MFYLTVITIYDITVTLGWHDSNYFFKLSDYVDTVFVKYTKYEIAFFSELFIHVLSASG